MGNTIGRAEKDIRGLIGKTTTEMIRDDHPEVLPQASNEITEQKTPSGVTVQAHYDGADALVDVVHAIAL
jgi:YD repeat-containing protein